LARLVHSSIIAYGNADYHKLFSGKKALFSLLSTLSHFGRKQNKRALTRYGKLLINKPTAAGHGDGKTALAPEDEFHTTVKIPSHQKAQLNTV
jgi:hypothetical protein